MKKVPRRQEAVLTGSNVFIGSQSKTYSGSHPHSGIDSMLPQTARKKIIILLLTPFLTKDIKYD